MEQRERPHWSSVELATEDFNIDTWSLHMSLKAHPVRGKYCKRKCLTYAACNCHASHIAKIVRQSHVLQHIVRVPNGEAVIKLQCSLICLPHLYWSDKYKLNQKTAKWSRPLQPHTAQAAFNVFLLYAAPMLPLATRLQRNASLKALERN